MDGFEWREQEGVRWLAAELPGAEAAFTTRLGGVGEPPYDTLNLGLTTGDDEAAVGENRLRLALALGLDPSRIGCARQVHGKDLARTSETRDHWTSGKPDAAPEADGQVVLEPGDAGLVFVADCVPIVVAGSCGVATLHGGWRGLAAGIVAAGVAAVDGVAAAIGPSIGPCCYEVGDEALAAFTALGPGIAEGRMLDLWAVARALLERAGIQEMVCAELCTRCHPEVFFSHRGQGPATGRQAGVGWIEPKHG